jgi:hypothetical protein
MLASVCAALVTLPRPTFEAVGVLAAPSSTPDVTCRHPVPVGVEPPPTTMSPEPRMDVELMVLKSVPETAIDGAPVPVVFLRMPLPSVDMSTPLTLVTVAESAPVLPEAVTSPVMLIVWSPVLAPDSVVMPSLVLIVESVSSPEFDPDVFAKSVA